MKILTDFRKTVETGMDPRLEAYVGVCWPTPKDSDPEKTLDAY